MFSTVLHVVGAVICFGAGYYAHYKWGATVSADVAKVKSVV